MTRLLRHSAQAEEPASVDKKCLHQATQIGDIVTRVSRHTPWKSPCLAQVLAVQHMLSARGIPGVFYLGVHKEQYAQSKRLKMTAHAWLKCGSDIINGADGHEAFTVVSSWSWPK